jgi:hypothetical protein
MGTVSVSMDADLYSLPRRSNREPNDCGQALPQENYKPVDENISVGAIVGIQLSQWGRKSKSV